MTEERARVDLVAAARATAERGLSHGSTGNVSVRHGDQILVTPTRCSLATVTPKALALIDLFGRQMSEAVPSKEAGLHAAIYRARPQARAIVHTHSLYATAVSCMAGLDSNDVLPPLSAYYAMRVQALPLVEYCAPGDPRLAESAGRTATRHATMLLSNHGLVVAAETTARAVEIAEEIEQTAQLFLLLAGNQISPLDDSERQRLFARSQEKEG